MSSEPWVTIETTAKVEASTGKSTSYFRANYTFPEGEITMLFPIKMPRSGEALQLALISLSGGREGGETRVKPETAGLNRP